MFDFKKRMIIFTAVVLLIIGCSDDPVTEETEAQSGERINVRMLYDDEVRPNEETTLRVQVQQAGEQVDDAEEVIFEIWPHGRSYESVELEAEHAGEGIYESEHTFDEENLFYVQPRVSARNRQSMTLSELIVGDFLIRSENMELEEGEGEGELPEDFIAFFGVDRDLVAGEPSILTVQANYEKEPWTDGEVLIDIKKDDGSPETFETVESEPGVYQLEHIFNDGGAYDIVIHFHDDDQELDAQIKDKLEVYEDEDD
ncbi:FixH family protein [Alteribacter aurantiacus]|uniref:FixH family protein n=1 Tax=Alteribacter aurantiacus TaxID=254410 RepID=UPI000424F762|nr:FixH family protein [Alteribacter aurantiacus]